MSQPVAPFAAADKRVVFDLLEDLRAAWEKILNDYADARPLGTARGGVRYVDAWMACHNFFKLALDNVVRDAGLEGAAAAVLFEGAGETFQMAMRVRADQARAAARKAGT